MKRYAAVVGVAVLLSLTASSCFPYHWVVRHNWRVVEEGKFYGARQMSGSVLEETFEKHGIRTLVNFRGESPDERWYTNEVAACEAAGVAHVNYSWSKSTIPDPESLQSFVELIDQGEAPFLVHCQGGTHRTGVAAAIYLLMNGQSCDTARGQFMQGFNDAPIGQLVDLYETSTMPFREWVSDEYPALYEAWRAERERADAEEADEGAGAVAVAQ
jgi:protein tyrosine phosphatase (PTP) superfamily phosphohydrolase (DUF442 family)